MKSRILIERFTPSLWQKKLRWRSDSDRTPEYAQCGSAYSAIIKITPEIAQCGPAIIVKIEVFTANRNVSHSRATWRWCAARRPWRDKWRRTSTWRAGWSSRTGTVDSSRDRGGRLESWNVRSPATQESTMRRGDVRRGGEEGRGGGEERRTTRKLKRTITCNTRINDEERRGEEGRGGGEGRGRRWGRGGRLESWNVRSLATQESTMRRGEVRRGGEEGRGEVRRGGRLESWNVRSPATQESTTIIGCRGKAKEGLDIINDILSFLSFLSFSHSSILSFLHSLHSLIQPFSSKINQGYGQLLPNSIR